MPVDRDDALSDVFELEASPAKGQSLQENGKKRRKRSRQNERKQKAYKDVGHRILILCMHEEKMSLNLMLVEREAGFHVANVSWSRLELIWPISSLKSTKCLKNVFLIAKRSFEPMG